MSVHKFVGERIAQRLIENLNVFSEEVKWEIEVTDSEIRIVTSQFEGEGALNDYADLIPVSLWRYLTPSDKLDWYYIDRSEFGEVLSILDNKLQGDLAPENFPW